MPGTWHGIVPTEHEAPILATRYLVNSTGLSDELVVETPSTERWKISCKNSQATQRTALLATSKADKAATTRTMRVVHRKTRGTARRPVKTHRGTKLDKNVVATNNTKAVLRRGNSKACIAIQVVTRIMVHLVVPPRGNNKRLLHHRPRIMATTDISKATIKSVTGLLLLLRQQDLARSCSNIRKRHHRRLQRIRTRRPHLPRTMHHRHHQPRMLRRISTASRWRQT